MVLYDTRKEEIVSFRSMSKMSDSGRLLDTSDLFDFCIKHIRHGSNINRGDLVFYVNDDEMIETYMRMATRGSEVYLYSDKKYRPCLKDCDISFIKKYSNVEN